MYPIASNIHAHKKHFFPVWPLGSRDAALYFCLCRRTLWQKELAVHQTIWGFLTHKPTKERSASCICVWSISSICMKLLHVSKSVSWPHPTGVCCLWYLVFMKLHHGPLFKNVVWTRKCSFLIFMNMLCCVCVNPLLCRHACVPA